MNQNFNERREVNQNAFGLMAGQDANGLSFAVVSSNYRRDSHPRTHGRRQNLTNATRSLERIMARISTSIWNQKEQVEYAKTKESN